jgi:8-oxo-dGTP pyrophosphatase MutT (NUDIX family)
MAAAVNNVASVRRVLVGLGAHDTCGKPKKADFLTCLVHHFSPNKKSATINCKVQDDLLLLYSQNEGNKLSDENKESTGPVNDELDCVTLYHSPECPLWKLHLCSTPVTPSQERGIYVGVAVLVESFDSYVLMTQRSNHMRSFPRAWVPPGGHLEVGESLIHGALRELEEETGLVLDSRNTITHLLCLWESAYPPLIALGEPRSHHIVLYFHLKSSETWKQLQARIKLDPKEVQASTWLSRHNVQSIKSGHKGVEIIQQFIVGEDGQTHPAELNIHKMFYAELWQGGEIYTGSQLALTKWLERWTEPPNSTISSKM